MEHGYYYAAGLFASAFVSSFVSAHYGYQVSVEDDHYLSYKYNLTALVKRILSLRCSKFPYCHS